MFMLCGNGYIVDVGGGALGMFVFFTFFWVYGSGG